MATLPPNLVSPYGTLLCPGTGISILVLFPRGLVVAEGEAEANERGDWGNPKLEAQLSGQSIRTGV